MMMVWFSSEKKRIKVKKRFFIPVFSDIRHIRGICARMKCVVLLLLFVSFSCSMQHCSVFTVHCCCYCCCSTVCCDCDIRSQLDVFGIGMSKCSECPNVPLTSQLILCIFFFLVSLLSLCSATKFTCLPTRRHSYI